MGHFALTEFGDYYVGDDGKVYGSPEQKSVIAESMDELRKQYGGRGDPSGVETFTCKVCQEVFNNKLAMARHAKIHKRKFEE